jgi:lysophospholipase L1-like esterase
MAKARIVNVQFNDEPVDFSPYTYRLLAEGDSWFAWSQFSLAPSSNVLEQLEFPKPAVIVSLAYSGDVIRDISDTRRNMALYFELQALRYHALLLSGGGNDLIDALRPKKGGPAIIVPRSGSVPDTASVYVDSAALKALTDNVLAGYRRIIAQRDDSDANAHTPIVLHTYDYPTPRDARATLVGRPAIGPWLLPALNAASVPAGFYQAVTDIVFNAQADALLTLDDPANAVHVVDTRGTIARADPNTTGLSGDWINEIHPDAHGYALLAGKVAQTLAGLGIS